MKSVDIDLGEPFEKIVATVLSLPAGCSDGAGDGLANTAEVKQAIRGLYEAANGRQVETNIGLVAIAPPAFEFLKARPFRVGTQNDLFIEAAARLIAGPVPADSPDAKAEALVINNNGNKRAARYRPNDRARTALVLNAG